jgi:chloramphenicol-sensitive protein RarD
LAQATTSGSAPNDQTAAGLAYGITAFALWAGIPVYFKLIQSLPALEILGHRILWSAVVCALLLRSAARWAAMWAVFGDRRRLAVFTVTTIMLATNWLVYIWAINTDRLIDTSIGYYINPLFNVLLGFVFLRERLRPWQWTAVALAAIGVANLTWHLGQLPWIALFLAANFGIYGLIRKVVPVGAIEGLAVETLIILPFGIAYLAWLGLEGSVSYVARDLTTNLLLPLTGIATVLPLLFFTEAARRLKLSTVGLLQYIAPSGHFVLAVFVYGEILTTAHIVTFACIWTALIIYSIDSWRGQRGAG